MQRFHYRAYNAVGGLEAGEIEASSIKQALDTLADRGLHPFETSTIGPRRMRQPAFLRLRQRRVPLTHYAAFTRQLASFLEADIPVDQALKLLATTAGPGWLRTFATKLHERIAGGMSLSTAIEIETPEAPAYISSIVKAGEARGNLAAIFAELSVFIEARTALTHKLKSTLTYPLILALAAIATLAVVVTILVPSLMPLFQDAGTQPPFVLAALNSVSVAIATHGIEFVTLAALFVASMVAALRSEAARYALDVSSLKVPVLGDFLRRSGAALFAHTLATLLRSGMAMVPALKIASSVLTNKVLASASRSAAEKVEEGQRLSLALQATGAFPKLAIQLISVGEETGKLDQLLSRLARILDDDNEKKLEAGMALLGPALTVVIGLGVGSLVLSVMRALLSVNELVFK